MGADVLTVLQERGFIAQLTDETAVRAQLLQGPTVIYTGYDPTADSLHVGNLVTLMALKHLEKAGHRPVVLLGDGTAHVGDPSGKTETRPMLDKARIVDNAQAIGKQIGRFLDVTGPTQVVNNADWLAPLNYIDFLRDIGRHFSVNRMLQAEGYKQRMERGLSFIEFNYQLLQAYDFLALRRRLDCRIQFGGDDQWGNILAGVDLCRRVDQTLVHGMTCPLLTTATGDKMGKTATGAVWLDGAKMSPPDYYQYWVNTHDDDLTRLLAIFTFLPMQEIRQAETLSGASRNMAKSVLAYEATLLAHGVEAAQTAHAAAQGAFGDRVIPADLLPSSQIPRAPSAREDAIASTAVSAAQMTSGLLLVDVLTTCGLVGSKNDARRLISQGAVRVGDMRPENGQFMLTLALFTEGPVLLRVGKKRTHRLILAPAKINRHRGAGSVYCHVEASPRSRSVGPKCGNDGVNIDFWR